MSDIKWIKIATDIFDNRKIRQILKMENGDKMVNIWFRLLCLTGISNNHGFITLLDDIPYTIDMFSTEFSESETIIRQAIDVFRKYGMIGFDGNAFYIHNWEEYQNVDSMEKIREQGRERTKRWRNKKECNVTSDASCDVTSRHGDVTVTQQNKNKNIDIDKDIEIDIEKDKEKEREKEKNNSGEKRSVFRPPTLEDIQLYCQERNNTVDADRFIDYYTSNGWHVGKNKMKDWRAAVRTWERNGYANMETRQQKPETKSEKEEQLKDALNNWIKSDAESEANLNEIPATGN